ncbi:photosystem II 5 kDa protein, chloroplastic-like [Magnolia sinica]|uniref:photosystem II 5 kDa protein, chloroplastic-like n=1 Tax=Magnolia sinica TaxID=86752 RepID=UPI002657C889|nr:photosystem II 5 kDa protein, chloroplastic-like [Magnolia sinica]
MASITMAASFIGTVNVSERPSMNRRRLVMATATEADHIEKPNRSGSSTRANNSRRDVMFAAAAVAICSAACGHDLAIATEGPKPGTPEAKKIYAPVCVTMPTARICHK